MMFGVEPGQEYFGPCRIYDANGLEYHFVVCCNNETGYIKQLVVEDGYFILDETGGAVERREFYAAKPLLLVPVKPGEMVPQTLGTKYRGCTCQTWVATNCPLYETAHKRDRTYWNREDERDGYQYHPLPAIHSDFKFTAKDIKFDMERIQEYARRRESGAGD